MKKGGRGKGGVREGGKMREEEERGRRKEGKGAAFGLHFFKETVGQDFLVWVFCIKLFLEVPLVPKEESSEQK
jgi:hypothetical protein